MILGILLALMFQQPVQCRVYKLSNPVAVQCGADIYDIPWQEWPKEWGSWPSTRTFYYLVPESRERLQSYARRGFPAYIAVTTSPDRPAVVMKTEDAESLYEELKDGHASVMFKALAVALGKLPQPQTQPTLLQPWDLERERWQRQPLQNDFPTRPDN